MQTEIVLHLGSNLGDRHDQLQSALTLIKKFIGTISDVSSIYETAAWGHVPQAAFLNMAIKATTSLEPHKLIKYTQAIETLLGKDIQERWGPRSIDIDILFYGDTIIDTEHLQIPHPRLQDRNFVLVPLLDITPDWEHPILLKQICILHDECTDDGKVDAWYL